MKTHSLIRLLPCTLLLAGGLSFTACSDDDDTSSIPDTELTDTESATAQELSRLLGMLCEDEELSTGWATRTVPPTVGQALDPTNPFVRTMTVASEAEAREYFRDLAGFFDKDDADKTTWQCAGIGTLAYQPLNQSDCFATISVDIKQVPELTTIRLVPVSALGENVSNFEAYYNFGDVLQNTEDGTIWVCGRPACAWAGKTKSYWFSFNLVEKNVKSITKYKYPCNFHKTSESHKDKVKAFGSFIQLMHNVDDGWENYEIVEKDVYGNDECDPISEVIPYINDNIQVLHELAKDWSGAEKQFTPEGVDIDWGDKFALFLSSNVSGKKAYQDWYKFTVGAKYEIDMSMSNRHQAGYLAPLDDDDEEYLSEGPSYYPEAVRMLLNLETDQFDIREYGKTGRPGAVNHWVRGDVAVAVPAHGLPVRVRTGYELSTKLVGNPDPSKELPGVGSKLKVLYRMPTHKFHYPAK